jgi:hypothetical protein
MLVHMVPACTHSPSLVSLNTSSRSCNHEVTYRHQVRSLVAHTSTTVSTSTSSRCTTDIASTLASSANSAEESMMPFRAFRDPLRAIDWLTSPSSLSSSSSVSVAYSMCMIVPQCMTAVEGKHTFLDAARLRLTGLGSDEASACWVGAARRKEVTSSVWMHQSNRITLLGLDGIVHGANNATHDGRLVHMVCKTTCASMSAFAQSFNTHFIAHPTWHLQQGQVCL